jgi:hypothetical protein
VRLRNWRLTRRLIDPPNDSLDSIDALLDSMTDLTDSMNHFRNSMCRFPDALSPSRNSLSGVRNSLSEQPQPNQRLTPSMGGCLTSMTSMRNSF